MDIDIGGKVPVTLPDDIYGILGIRSWNLKENSRNLQSLFAGQEWAGSVLKTQRPTALPGEHGFYAYRLTPRLDMSWFTTTFSRSALFPAAKIQVHGLVELRGRVIEHTDGVIRGEWCRILCFFLPVPSSDTEMKTQVRESEWLKSTLAQYNVPVYLTESNRFGAIFEKLMEFDRGRDNLPAPVEYEETRPGIVKKVDELVDQAFLVGFHVPHIYLNRTQMKEFKTALGLTGEPVESQVIYKRIRINCINYDDARTPYLLLDVRSAG